jgi:16S rRNA (guanine966-N2)-methyltransferase
MRVVAGRLKGRRLKPVPGPRTRPTSDRVREALFQILGGKLEPTPTLDLFAGTGALGIEAWSRGAEPIWFVESDSRALRVLHENLRQVRIDPFCHVFELRAEAALPRLKARDLHFGLILADPPYAATRDFWQRSRDHWSALLSPSGVLVLEHGRGCHLPDPPGLRSLPTRVYGDSALSLWTRSEEAP